eukprot:TRINITY_DN21594_c0_g1_i1.p1 TRINITY_DN21594_c0_g1~~TRINITY_DN21594_c0_g1_i1.p1  ORF type:complete len:471 (-),score=55.28 TRINITY_DN21594_c0_g1_i1:322-1734(-)
MATITEEEEEEHQQQKHTNIPQKKEEPNSSKPSNLDARSNPFAFWAYLTLCVSLITFLFVTLSSLTVKDEKSWFLSLPEDLRLHYSKGKTIKVQTKTNHPPIEVFAIEFGPRDAETLVIVHGLGCSSYSFRHVVRSLGASGFRAIAIDLPGSGFSDNLVSEGNRWLGVLGRVWDVYNDIKTKGLFWGFDQLIETGSIPYEERPIKVPTSESRSEEMGRVIGQVVESMGLAPLHLVLHDSGLAAGTIWVSENPRWVSSVTLIDPASNSAALPSWVLEMPVVRELVLGFSFVYVWLLRFCCSKLMETSVSEAHRILLKGKGGGRGVVGVGSGLNYSFDLGEWAASEAVIGVPFQILWSAGSSEGWFEEGRRIADAVPRAKFFTHSGGRWPQEDAADEVTEMIAQFILSLPKSIRQNEEEPLPEHIQKMFDEAKNNPHQHHHDHHHHHSHGDHNHVHEANYMDAYGLGQGWGS